PLLDRAHHRTYALLAQRREFRSDGRPPIRRGLIALLQPIRDAPDNGLEPIGQLVAGLVDASRCRRGTQPAPLHDRVRDRGPAEHEAPPPLLQFPLDEEAALLD